MIKRTNHLRLKGLKVYSVSLGCTKNRVDTEEVLGYLAGRGAVLTDDYSSADLAFVNTCGFIEEAQQEAINTILELGSKKVDGKPILVVAGCLVEVYGSTILARIEEVDGAIGVHSYKRLDNLFKLLFAGIKTVLKDKPSAEYISLAPRILTTPAHSVNVKIAEGCSNRCSYCLIPSIRGDYRGRDEKSILDEISILVSGGAREIVLIAQDTTAYGSEWGDGKSLSKLIRKIMQLPEKFWLRIMYTYPSRIDDDLIDLIASESRICNYLDIPIQHTDDLILKMMGRHYNNTYLKSLIDKLRVTVPGIALRTTLMVGFPGETRSRFQGMLDFIESRPFEKMGAFVYSRQDGTTAVDQIRKVPRRIAERRRAELMIKQQEIALRLNRDMVGKNLIVLVDKAIDSKENWYVGRSEHQAPDVDGVVYMHSDKPLKAGGWVRAKISAVSPYNLLALKVTPLDELPV
ncbi:MAG: 30S ribosomal protein S12 methylthiotransferase RimO [Bacillota bacterium]|nr:30S ribosomal protein S12 methylthiotransferase RimO [Bacillota bacterium]